jgi:NADPH2:quinone reductase
MSSMKAVVCTEFAGLNADGRPAERVKPICEVLRLNEIPSPSVGSNDVLVKVHFAGVQYPDLLQAQGFYQVKPQLPYTPGADLSGVIQQLGSDVPAELGLKVGDRVVGQVETGALAELAAVPSDSILKVPNNVPLDGVANLGRNYFAAYHSLKVISDLQPGQAVLVDGASGGVGMAAIRLAKAMGAMVVAGVSREARRQVVLDAGADAAFVYGNSLDSSKAFKNEVREYLNSDGRPDGFDVILDMVQGELFETALLSLVRPLGKVCLIGFTAGQKAIRPGMILIKQASVVGSLWSPWAKAHPQQHRDNMEQVMQYFADGKIIAQPDRTFRFQDYLKAFELFEQREGQGNTVVQIASDAKAS